MLRFTNMQFIIVTTRIVFSKPHRMHRILFDTPHIPCTSVSSAKTAEPIEMPFGEGADSCGLKEALIDAVHIGATWRIPINDPCAAAIRQYVKLLCPLIIK